MLGIASARKCIGWFIGHYWFRAESMQGKATVLVSAWFMLVDQMLPLFIVLGIGNSSHVCFGPIIVQRSRGRIDGNSFFFLVGFFFLLFIAHFSLHEKFAYIYYRSVDSKSSCYLLHSQSLDSKSRCYLVPSLSYLLHSFTIRIYTVPPFGRHYIYSHACSQQILLLKVNLSLIFASLRIPFVIPFGHNSLGSFVSLILTTIVNYYYSCIFSSEGTK